MNVQPSISVSWSPDSKKLVTYRLDKRTAGKLTVVQSLPPEGVRPTQYTYVYPLAGEPGLSRAEPVVFDVESRRQIPVECEQIGLLYYEGPSFDWFEDSRRFHFTYMERGYQRVQLLEVDVSDVPPCRSKTGGPAPK